MRCIIFALRTARPEGAELPRREIGRDLHRAQASANHHHHYAGQAQLTRAATCGRAPRVAALPSSTAPGHGQGIGLLHRTLHTTLDHEQTTKIMKTTKIIEDQAVMGAASAPFSFFFFIFFGCIFLPQSFPVCPACMPRFHVSATYKLQVSGNFLFLLPSRLLPV